MRASAASTRPLPTSTVHGPIRLHAGGRHDLWRTGERRAPFSKDSMTSSSSDTPHPVVELRSLRASSVIVHRVPTDSVDGFLAWQRGITQAAEGLFPGYQTTDVYPPVDGRHQEWVVVVHFDTPEALRRWLDSSVRAEWTARLAPWHG